MTIGLIPPINEILLFTKLLFKRVFISEKREIIVFRNTFFAKQYNHVRLEVIRIDDDTVRNYKPLKSNDYTIINHILMDVHKILRV